MRLHIITVGKPKLSYAVEAWDEYLSRLKRMHTVRVTQIADKHAYDPVKFAEATTGTYVIAMEIQGTNLSSRGLADLLRTRELAAQEVSFVIGGPDGLPEEVRNRADYQWSLSQLTLPHDLAMVVTLEALYRASTINAGLPYHR